MGAVARICRALGLIALCTVADSPPDPSRCRLAMARRDWPGVLEACAPDGQGPPDERMSRAWALLFLNRDDEALVVADELVRSGNAPEARYVAGTLRVRHRGEQHRGRQLLQEALALQLMRGDLTGAARASCDLVRAALDYDEQLALTGMCDLVSAASGDRQVRAFGLNVVAMSYDQIGLAEEAKQAFLDAAELAERDPQALAWVYFKHAAYLLDLRDPASSKLAVHYLDAAERQLRAAATPPEATGALASALTLNRAIAQSELGDDVAARAEMARIPPDLATDARVLMVRARLAARRDDVGTASLLALLATAGGLKPDYALSLAVDLGRMHVRASRLDDAAAAFERGIAIVEEQRRAGAIELRPWILAHRATPYRELVGVRVAQGRAADALAAAETLHARTWLDAVAASPTRGDAPTPDLLDAPGLLATVGDREALVYLEGDGAKLWRAHVVDGTVTMTQLPTDARSVIDRFVADAGNRALADAAATYLLPAALGASGDPLYVVATGPLAAVPFPALRRAERFLIEDRPIARLPGLAVLRCVDGRWRDARIYVGDASGDLPDAAREVTALAAAGGDTASIGPAATRAAVLAAHDATLLHVAVHAERTARGSVLALADGGLSAAAIVRARVAPEVAVVAGCATATSPDAESWGAFPSAFLAAGSRNVIATLRPVDDGEAAIMMRAYAAEGGDPIRRLAAAQRASVTTLPVTTWASFSAWGVADCPR